MRRIIALVALSCSIVLAGCAPRGVTVVDATNVITGDQLRGTGARDLFDAIRAARPLWLRARATASLTAAGTSEPLVYVQGMRRGPLAVLREMPTESVREVEFIGAADATTRFGTGHPGGIIMVTLDRR